MIRMSSVIAASAASVSPRWWESMKRSSSSRSAALASGDAQSSRRPAGRLALHRVARPLQRAVDGRDPDLEQFRDVLRRPVEHVAQDQHRALARREQLDHGQERELDRLAREQRRVRLLVGRQQRVRVGLQPRDVAERAQRRHAPLLGLDRVQARVGGDLVQPRAQVLVVLELGPFAPRPQQRLLHQVLGVLEGSHHPVAVDVQFTPVTLGPRGELGFGRHGMLRRRLAETHRNGGNRSTLAACRCGPPTSSSPTSTVTCTCWTAPGTGATTMRASTCGCRAAPGSSSRCGSRRGAPSRRSTSTAGSTWPSSRSTSPRARSRWRRAAAARSRSASRPAPTARAGAPAPTTSGSSCGPARPPCRGPSSSAATATAAISATCPALLTDEGVQAVGTITGTRVRGDALRLDVHLAAWAKRTWERTIRCDGVVRWRATSEPFGHALLHAEHPGLLPFADERGGLSFRGRPPEPRPARARAARRARRGGGRARRVRGRDRGAARGRLRPAGERAGHAPAPLRQRRRGLRRRART